MANHKIFAVVFAHFALLVTGQSADKCSVNQGGIYKLKPDLNNLYCPTNDKSCSSTSGGFCLCGSACCMQKTSICASYTYSTSCSNNRIPAASKQAYAVKTDKSDYDTQCCMEKKTCDISCGAAQGLKDKANKNSIKCALSICSTNECCDTDATRCAAKQQTCGSGKTYDSSKAANTYTNYANDCCKTKPKCSTFSCPTGYLRDTAKSNYDCSSETCTSGECCTVDSARCPGISPANGQACDSTTEFKDSNNVNEATPATFKARCCSKKATCTEFKNFADDGVASATKKQQTATMAVLLAVGGAVALRK